MKRYFFDEIYEFIVLKLIANLILGNNAIFCDSD